jgi:uncharacterized membrane protein
MKRAITWVLAAIVLGVGLHVALIYALPHLVMTRAFARLGAANNIHHGARVDAASRTIVRPSPDLLYSDCPYDLSKGALRITATVPPNTYWSVSAFDSRTDNFFVLDDRDVNGAVDFVLIAKGMTANAGALPVVISPTQHGVLLFRTLIDDEKHFATLDKSRRNARCGAFTKG